MPHARSSPACACAHCVCGPTLLCEQQGVVAGVVPTGGHLGRAPDRIMRFQPSWAGGRIAHLLDPAGRCLPETRQCFTNRVRRNKGEKGMGKGRGSQAKERAKASSSRPSPRGPQPLPTRKAEHLRYSGSWGFACSHVLRYCFFLVLFFF